jgi:small neutral amino acid transporter SnatA (MarC family)
VSRFELYGYTVTLNYPPTALYFTREEVAVTLAGPLLVILVFVAALLFSYAIQRFLGEKRSDLRSDYAYMVCSVL